MNRARSWLRRSGVLVSLLALMRVAHADEHWQPLDPTLVDPAHPPVAASVGVGVLAALVPLVIGGGLLATRNLHDEQAGIYTLMGGLTLGPLMSHAVAHEWARAAAFSVVPLACALGMVAQVETRPQVFVESDKNDSRWTFAILVSVGVVSSAVGLIDSMLAGERARRRGLTVAPLAGRGQGGLAVGGVF